MANLCGQPRGSTIRRHEHFPEKHMPHFTQAYVGTRHPVQIPQCTRAAPRPAAPVRTDPSSSAVVSMGSPTATPTLSTPSFRIENETSAAASGSTPRTNRPRAPPPSLPPLLIFLRNRIFLYLRRDSTSSSQQNAWAPCRSPIIGHPPIPYTCDGHAASGPFDQDHLDHRFDQQKRPPPPPPRHHTTRQSPPPSTKPTSPLPLVPCSRGPLPVRAPVSPHTPLPHRPSPPPPPPPLSTDTAHPGLRIQARSQAPGRTRPQAQDPGSGPRPQPQASGPRPQPQASCPRCQGCLERASRACCTSGRRLFGARLTTAA